jgi:putative NADH-flavin reductase
MRLFIMGATGGTGRALVEQAINRGHQVTAFVRSPQKLGLATSGVTVVQGDPRNAAELGRAMNGAEAVLSALGPPIPFTGRTTIMGDAAKATIEAMRVASVRRLLSMSGDLQFPDAGPPKLLRVTLLRHLATDQAEMERVIQSSSLDWTIVRPTRLTNAASTGNYRSERDRMPQKSQPIGRADVAHFMLGALESGAHLRSVMGLAR